MDIFGFLWGVLTFPVRNFQAGNYAIAYATGAITYMIAAMLLIILIIICVMEIEKVRFRIACKPCTHCGRNTTLRSPVKTSRCEVGEPICEAHYLLHFALHGSEPEKKAARMRMETRLIFGLAALNAPDPPSTARTGKYHN